MTREERDQKQAERLKKEIEERSKKLAEVAAKIEENDRAKRDKKRYQVGTLADTYGLCHWDLPTLAGLFQILATFRETPDPVAVLESLRADRTPSALTPAAAGPCCLTSSGASDASDVSQGRGGVCSPDRGNKIAQLGVSRGEKRQMDRTGGAEHGPCGLDAHGL